VEGLPPQVVVGELYVVPLAGGSPRKVGSGVTNLPGGYLFTPDGKCLLFRTGFDVTLNAGQLERVFLEGADQRPVVLGKVVTVLTVSPDSRYVAWVDAGILKRQELASGETVDVSGEVALSEFSPKSDYLFIRRTLAAGGGFLVQPLTGNTPPVKVSDRVGDFKLASDGKRVALAKRSDAASATYDLWVAEAPAFSAKQVAREVASFTFSNNGQLLARIEGQRPGVLGYLVVGPGDGSAGRKLGERVRDFALAPDGTAVAFVEHYDEHSRQGRMAYVALPNGEPKRMGRGIENYEWGSDGKSLAYLEKLLTPVPTVDLFLYRGGDEKPVKVGEGVFGYGFAPKNAFLLLRTHCTREGRSCDLRRINPQEPTRPPEQLIEGVYSFRLSSDGGRLLVSYARLDSDSFDLAAYDFKTRALEVLDRAVTLPGYWVGNGSDQAAYAVVDRSRAGLYVAPVFKAAAAKNP
jgi:hypothetical protein